MAVNTVNHIRAINWLSQYIFNNPHASTSYKDIVRVLNEQKEYFIKCYIADNKYLYGSFISEAKSLSMTITSSGLSC